MKKQLFSILTATAMTLSAMPFTAVAEYQDSNSAVITAEDQSETYYWIFYKNIDMTDIESKAEEKREEYIYSLYEQDLTQREFERLSTEYYISVRQELLKKSYTEQTEKILNEIGVNPETAFCSTCSSTIVCPLNDEQLEKAEKCEVITDISVYTAPKIEGTSDNKNETAYWIFYKNIDMTDIESKAEEKREEYIYSLYEQDLTQNELERLSTEYYASVRQELLKEAYAEKSEIVVKELGIDSSKAFCSMFAPTIIATLTEEQKLIAEKSELIESISVYTPVDIQPTDDNKTYSTKEEFINIITAGKDITELLGENIKVDAELNCKKDDAVFDYFVIYGIENDKKINGVINRLSSNPDVKVMISPVISKSGTFFSISVENIATQHEIQGVAFVDNEYPCWISPQTIESFTSTYDFNPLKYIIKLGDTNCDGNVNMADAVLIMQSLANPNKYGINGTDETHITSLGEKNGDMDGNGLTNADALEIQKKLLKISVTDTGEQALFPVVKIHTANEMSQYEEMKKNKPVVIRNEYNPLLSSASGIGILFDFYYPNNSVNLSADKGTFKTWDIEKGSGAVESVGKTYTIENEGYIFWTPDKESIFGDEKIIIHITDSKNVNLGEIVITHDENGVFSAVLN